ncbi:MAG: FtsH protease activity modulator HflK [Spirochaetales bacterium]|nr:MAG: FtsH protease activity modulator HflK [Spirochaetales bacterium]
MSERDVSPPKLPFTLRPRLIVIVLVVVVLIALTASSFFVVDQTAQGVVLRFGQFRKTVEPGLHFKMPFGIDQNYNVPVQEAQREEFGFRTDRPGETSLFSGADFTRESGMLTGDLNIIDVEWTIQYRITDARAWLFNVESISGGIGVRAMPPPGAEASDRRVKTIRDVTQSVVNALMGDRAIVDVIGSERAAIQVSARDQMNKMFTSYGLGISVTEVQLRNVVPPEGRVQDAFDDVNRAVQDFNRLINEGREQYNAEIPRADGQAQRLIEEAEGYRVQRTNTAKGDVSRFNEVLGRYRIDPVTTRTRLYYEMMEEVFAGEQGVELVDRNLRNFLPILNLNGSPATGGVQ